jgi:hypothetical protein
VSVHLKSLVLGAVLALLGLAGAAALLFSLGRGDYRPVFREQVLPSGRRVAVTALHLAWGTEHGERTVANDALDVEFVLSSPGAPDAAREAEAREVFDLVRPLAEQLGLRGSTVSAFPQAERKGHYDQFLFRRAPSGPWTVERKAAKVFANE